MPTIHLHKDVKVKMDKLQDFLSEKNNRHVSHNEIIQDLINKYGKIYARHKK